MAEVDPAASVPGQRLVEAHGVDIDPVGVGVFVEPQAVRGAPPACGGSLVAVEPLALQGPGGASSDAVPLRGLHTGPDALEFAVAVDETHKPVGSYL